MKRITRIVTLIMVLVFAVQISKLPVYAMPAPAVTALRISDCYVNHLDGFVYVEVEVTGYGSNAYATYDSNQCQLMEINTDGRPIVRRHYYLYKCRFAQVGTHLFAFRITSSNRPWNTKSESWNIIVK